MFTQKQVLKQLGQMTAQLNRMEKKLYAFRVEGCEDIPEYCQAQKKRIEDAILQVRLVIDDCHLDALNVEEWEIYDEEEMQELHLAEFFPC